MSNGQARKKGSSHNWPMYDQDLFAAKKAKRKVRFIMAVEVPGVGTEDVIEGLVTRIDRFNVEVVIDSRCIWLSKLFIVSTEVVK